MPGLGEQLSRLLRGRGCLVGLGSESLGDDALGMQLARRCAEVFDGNPVVRLAGLAPERHLAFLADEGFDHVIFLDAVALGGVPGSAALLDAREMESRFPQISTHRLSLGLLARWIEQNGRTTVHLLGVQPAALKEGAGLSAPVARSVELLGELLVRASDGSDGSDRFNAHPLPC
jgi:hydrogenase maturation protease